MMNVSSQELSQLLPSSGYVVCLGVNNYPSDVVHFTSKNVRLWGTPFDRVVSIACDLLYKTQNRIVHPNHCLYNFVCCM